MGKNKWSALLLGYVVLWASFFGYRIYKVLTMEIADGQVWAISWHRYGKLIYRRNSRVDARIPEMCPEIHFQYQYAPADTLVWIKVWPRAMSVDWYKPGDRIRVIFPKGKPYEATIYSAIEFWFELPYALALAFVSLLGTVVYAFVVLKPWEQLRYD